MLLPIGDEPNDSVRAPWMNFALIAANVIVFVLMSTNARTPRAFQELIFTWGYTPGDPTVVTLFSSMFVHAGWMHLAGNMLFLWIFGDNIEARLGSIGYLFAYLAVGAAATLTFAAFNQGSDMPLVGASGAISGVQGLYFIACPRHRVKVFLWLYFYLTVVLVPARLIMAFWFVLQDVVPLLIDRSPAPGGGVAHLAHLGGFVAGFVLMLLLKPFVKRVGLAASHEGPRPRRALPQDPPDPRGPYRPYD